MLKITTPVGNTGMEFGHLAPSFLAILGPRLLLGMPPLQPGQPLLFLREEPLVAGLLPRRERHHVVQPQVEAHGLGRDRQWCDLLLHQEGDEVPSSSIPADRDGAGFDSLWQRTTPADG